MAHILKVRGNRIQSFGRKGMASLAILSLLSACVAAERAPSRTPAPAAKNALPSQKPTTPALPVRPSVVRAPVGLENLLDDQWRAFPGRTGVAIMRIDGGEWITGKRADELFPQQSVSKTWVALTILDLVDQGKIRLDQKIRITRDDLAVFHQPIRDRVIANGEIDVTVLSLLEQAIIGSDNTANDSLLRTAGGPQAVQNFLLRKKLGAIRFGPGERAMQSAIAGLEWRQEYAIGQRFYAARAEVPLATRKAALDRYLADPIDGASPEAIVRALAKLAKGELLSPASTRLILGIMSRTSSGPNRLKAGVPAGWQFVHKTGTGQILPPVATGYNDIGLMTAPDGTRYAVAVMMGSTTASIPQRMAFMQFVSRTVATYHGQ
ncbi:metallo-hydrolase family protein [Sphingorhabdus wooponensis]|uniref:beta-lactamase n=2 Tax=Sphingorhabdus wooponensis TaxID=940136 RepID=A0A3R8S411_9SPHN|nr:metallo-hydrolase family protein [Sphingorhabdus wooponensis]